MKPVKASGEQIFKRASGILLHPTSLPGKYGIGDIGPMAEMWIGWLQKAGCHIWQVLPLCPIGFGDSPYQGFSAFAGNPLLISPDRLIEDGLLMTEDLTSQPQFKNGNVDFQKINTYKKELFFLAAKRFGELKDDHLKSAYRRFCMEERLWLQDYALFMALKNEHHGKPWTEWEADLANRNPAALEQAVHALAEEIEAYKIIQFLFFKQWASLRNVAKRAGVIIIGDIPIFVAHDSADVWANPELFWLDDEGMPTVVAGVPPDYFSPTGQRWGNPLYRWDVMRESGYGWWMQRFKAVLKIVDVVRLDHFRGFEGYWEIPAECPTAEVGRWAPGPGADFFEALMRIFGSLPIIAEDLGVITPEVKLLRDTFKLPGMKVLQFAFGKDATHPFLPHNYIRRCVAYTGTHDNDTIRGWYETAPESERDFCRRYLRCDGSDISWDMISAVWSSVAVWAIAPLQDLLSLGSEARMNFPGSMEENWSWRVPEEQLSDELAARMQETNQIYGR